MKKIFLIFVLTVLFIISNTKADDGYRLWLKYDLISNQQKLNEYKGLIKAIEIEGKSPTIDAAKHELQTGLSGLLGSDINEVKSVNRERHFSGRKISGFSIAFKNRFEKESAKSWP